MKTLSILLPVLIFCCFEVISARSIENSKVATIRKWLDMKLEDINEQCKKNVDYIIDRAIYSDYKDELMKFLGPVVSDGINPSKRMFDLMYDPTLIEKMKNLIEHIQDCLDEKNRLDSKDLLSVFGDTLYLHALRVTESEVITKKDKIQCQEEVTGDKIEDCFKTMDNIMNRNPFDDEMMTVLDILTGNVVGRSTCNEILPLEQCFMKATITCGAGVQKMFKIMLSPPEVVICENFLRKSEPDVDDNLNDIFSEKRRESPIIRLG